MPSISWRTARTELAAILADVSITDPTTDNIKRVYTTPHKSVADYPSLMIVGVDKAEPVRSPSLREREYTARIRIIIRDADLNRAADIIDAFQEAIIDALDNNLTLNGTVSNLNGPRWLEAGPIPDAGEEYQACDALVRFRMFDDPTFAP